MAKYGGKAGARVKPENDWRVHKTWIIDHWTGGATEINGVGEVREVRLPRSPVDPDLAAAMNERHAEMHARRVAERDRRLKDAGALISQLRREYQAKGSVLNLGDLMRELKRRARDEQAPRSSGGVASVGAALDEFANAPIVRVNEDVRNPRHFAERDEEASE